MPSPAAIVCRGRGRFGMQLYPESMATQMFLGGELDVNSI